MKKKIGFIFADDLEYKPFAEYALNHGGKQEATQPQNVISLETDKAIIYAMEGGVGKVYATISAMILMKEYKVDYLLSAGLSGAISGVKKGDLVAGTTYIECDFDMRPLGYDRAHKVDGAFELEGGKELLDAAQKLGGMKFGKLGTGDFFLTDPKTKAEFKEAFGIMAFDMESGAMACACAKFHVPYLSVRKISDDADEDEDVGASYRALNELQELALTEVLMRLVDNLE